MGTNRQSQRLVVRDIARNFTRSSGACGISKPGKCAHETKQKQAGPAEQAERNETYRLALSLIAKLPDDCRSAFMLTQLDGYTYDEAAAIENLSRGTVASRVYRARQILMEQMNDHLAGEVP